MDMKLNIWHRVLMFIGALLMVIIGVAIIIGSLQFNDIPIRLEGEGFFTITRLLLILMGLVTILYGVFMLTLPQKLRSQRHAFVMRKTDSGELRISVQAIEGIIQKSLSQYDEIKQQSLKVINARNGVIVDLVVALPGNINIPLAVNSLQKHIKKQLNLSSGIDAKEIRIIVENTDTNVKDSPYLVRPEELNLQPEQKPKEANTIELQETPKGTS